MFFLGIDPDMHSTAIACIDENFKPCFLLVVKISHDLKEREALKAMADALRKQEAVLHQWPIQFTALAVEAQELHKGSGANPRDILKLSTVGGMCLASFSLLAENMEVYFPAPQAWKGSVPKQIHQGRVLSKIGLTYAKVGNPKTGYCVPTDCKALPVAGASGVNPGDWKHVADAFGLAIHAVEQYTKQAAFEKFRQALPPRPKAAKRAQELLSQERESHAATKTQLATVERSRAAIAGAAKRVRNRLAAGVCPCCNRTFKQLAEHMKAKHPNYKHDEPGCW